MRSARLLALLMELSRVPHTSVARLAAHHGVSTRTIQRDISALHEMGVPVWTRTGPAGGVGIVGGWRSPLTGMTTPELRTLVIGEAASRDLGMHSDYDSARSKMLGSAPAQADAVAPAQERFLIDNERWFAPSGRPEALSTVARAVWSGRRLTIVYRRSGHPGGAGSTGDAAATAAAATRLVDPLGLVLKTDSWYLVAAHRRRLRTYRLSRIESCRVHEESSRRPGDFSLAEYWARSRAQFESSIHTLPVRLVIPEISVEHLEASVPGSATRTAVESARRHCSDRGADRDSDRDSDRLEIELLMEKASIAVSQLLAVPGVEVLEPAELRRELLERAEAIAARNRTVSEVRSHDADLDR